MKGCVRERENGYNFKVVVIKHRLRTESREWREGNITICNAYNVALGCVSRAEASILLYQLPIDEWWHLGGYIAIERVLQVRTI